MSNDMDRVENALYALYSRLGVIEGKVNLVARAERKQLLEVLEELIRDDPLIGQVYLLLDGSRHQRQLLEKLSEFGIEVSEATVSRRTTKMHREYGIAEIVDAGREKVYAKDPAMEQVLNLSLQIKKWLRQEDRSIPEPSRKRRKS